MHLKYVSPWDQCVCNCYHISRPSMAILRNSAVSPNFFNNSHNVHKRLIVLCTGAFFNTSSNLFCFFQGRVNRVPIYCDSWHNVDILIVVTMLNVDAWRRSSVGWEKLSPSMQSTVCSPFHCFAHICIGFCSYLQCIDCICIGFCSYLHWILLIIVLQLTLRTSQNVPAQTVSWRDDPVKVRCP